MWLSWFGFGVSWFWIYIWILVLNQRICYGLTMAFLLLLLFEIRISVNWSLFDRFWIYKSVANLLHERWQCDMITCRNCIMQMCGSDGIYAFEICLKVDFWAPSDRSGQMTMFGETLEKSIASNPNLYAMFFNRAPSYEDEHSPFELDHIIRNSLWKYDTIEWIVWN